MSTTVELSHECERCGKQFLTDRAAYGHQSMCPELDEDERSTTDEGEWYPDEHGRGGGG